MAEPTGSYTMYDLVTQVAEFAGLAYYGTSADKEAMAPIDLHDLSVCVRIVNNAVKMFISNAPTTGWRWQRRVATVSLVTAATGTATSGSATTLADSTLSTALATDYYNNGIIEITGGTGVGETAIITGFTPASGTFTFAALSDGSTPDTTTTYAIGHRYKLPDNFGGNPNGPPRYRRSSNLGTTLEWSDASFIEALRENTAESGTTELMAIRPYGTRQYEMLVYPDPVAANIVQFPYTLFFDKSQLVTGVATAGAATTLTDTVRRLEIDDTFNDWVLTVRSGIGLSETATITDFVQSTGVLTFSALSSASTPTTTSVYSIEPTDNKHPAGFQFDDMILSACLARAEMEIEDLSAGWANMYLNIDLQKAYERDAQLAPRTLGYFGNGPRYLQSYTGMRGRRTWADVTGDDFL